jgi:hypothetical protein
MFTMAEQAKHDRDHSAQWEIRHYGMSFGLWDNARRVWYSQDDGRPWSGGFGSAVALTRELSPERS